VRQAVVQVLTQLWPLLEQAIQQYKDFDTLVEKVCRCWKHGMRMAQDCFAPLIKPLLETVARAFSTSPRSALIYMLSSCLGTFHDRVDLHSMFQQCFLSVASVCMGLLSTPESFADAPDIVEDFFEMAVRYLKRIPTFMLQNAEMINTIFRCGLQGLLLQHREAYRGVASFIEAVLLAGGGEGMVRDPGVAPQPSPCRGLVEQMLTQHASVLCNGLFAGICGGIPSSRVRYATPIIQALVLVGRDGAKPILMQSLTHVVPDVQGPTKAEFLAGLYEGGLGWEKRVSRLVQDLSDACRRTTSEDRGK
jgi:transportin-3